MSDAPKIDPETDKFTEWFVVDFGSKYIGTREYIIMHMAWLAAIAAHAPTQEPSVPVSELKLLKRHDVNRWSNWIAAEDIDRLIHQAEGGK